MASDDLEPGSVIDGFRIEQRVHQGGMATLWRVTRGDQTVPLLMKIPKIFEGAEPAAIVSFEMEQMILPRLSGIHVPRYVVAGAFDKQPHVVMEQIPGVALIRRLGELPLPYAEVADIGRRVATALQDLHRQHVIHHDIKPSNIIFRPSGEAVLLDYGLAFHDQLPDLLHEEFRVPFGTAPYMAPERLRNIRHEPRSDIFSLGVLLYFFCHRRAAVRRERDHGRYAPSAVARSLSAAIPQARLSAMVPGDRTALSRDRAGMALRRRSSNLHARITSAIF